MRQSVRPTPTGYRIDFGSDDIEEPPFLTLDCEDVEQRSWGLLTTVVVRAHEQYAVMPEGFVVSARINLTKPMERRALAQRMGELMDIPNAAHHDWQRYLEVADGMVRMEANAPAPNERLWDRPVPDIQRFLIVGLLAYQKPNILYGAGGVGKSALSLRIAASLTTGGTFFGLDVMRRGRVLYLDWEDDIDTMTQRLDMITRGMGLRHRPQVIYRGLRGRGPYERHHRSILQSLEDDPEIMLVVIDSTAMAMVNTGDMAESAIRFYGLMNELPCTTLMLDHIASDDVKNPVPGAAKPYGSVFKVNAARNVWEAQRHGTADILLRHRKHNTGPQMDDVLLGARWDEDRVVYRRLATYADGEDRPNYDYD